MIKSGEIVRFIGNVVMNLSSLDVSVAWRRSDDASRAFIALADRRRMLAAAAASLMLLSSQAMAQPNAGASKGVPNALQGFSQNRNQPVQIEAASLEVRDKDKVATFSGNVKVVQGDTIMRCKSLVVLLRTAGQRAARRP